MSTRLQTGDKVRVISGGHKGEEAVITKVDKKSERAILDGINVVERHYKKTAYNPRGMKVTKQLGIHLSNLKLIEKVDLTKRAKDVKAAKEADKKEKK